VAEENRIDKQILAMRYHKKINLAFNRQKNKTHLSNENFKLVRRLEEIGRSKSEQFGGLPILKKKRQKEVTIGSLNYK